MQLEPGKTYTARDGSQITLVPYIKPPMLQDPATGFVYASNDDEGWRVLPRSKIEHPKDIMQ